MREDNYGMYWHKIDPPMTEIIKRLEKKNAVICTQSRLDGRYKKINCTDEYKNI